MVLRGADRGGAKNKRRAEADTRARCRAWLEGQRGSLWQPSRRSTRKRQDKANTLQREEQAAALVKEGLFQKACSTLSKEPPVEVTAAVVAQMEEKHPLARGVEAPRTAALRPIDSRAAPTTQVEEIEKAIRSFPKGSASGLTALRPQHLKDALVPGWKDEVLRKLVLVANLLAKGQAPTEIQPWLCGAALCALPKPDGGLRPVASGEVLRRLVSKCLLGTEVETLAEHLLPHQLAVGVKAGVETMPHLQRQWAEEFKHDKTRVCLAYDEGNAHNEVDRHTFLCRMREIAPGICRWLEYVFPTDAAT